MKKYKTGEKVNENRSMGDMAGEIKISEDKSSGNKAGKTILNDNKISGNDYDGSGIDGKKIIELDKVCYAYDGHVALRCISFNVDKGDVIVLQGPNGTGKSTLLKLLNGLIYADEGMYRFEGKEISAKTMKDSRFAKWFHQKMGFVFQNSDVQLFCANVEEEIAFGPLQMGLTDDQVSQRVEDVIRLLDIGELRERAPYHLSGGEKKKVAIACVLSMNPEILVLDEPLAGLDRQTQEWLTGFLLSLKNAGKTMIIATHNDGLAARLADRYILFNEKHEAAEEPAGGAASCEKASSLRSHGISLSFTFPLTMIK